MAHQDTPRDPDKPHSGRYAAITPEILLVHTTPDNENHYNDKLINWQIWDIHNQIRYHIHKTKITQNLLTYKELHYNELSYSETIKEII